MKNGLKRGFTLIELLIVLAIIGILAAILFPVFRNVREKARQTTCASNLQQIGLAVALYRNDEKQFPGSLAFLLANTAKLQDGGSGSLNENGTGYLKSDKVLVCSDDLGTGSNRSSYGDTSTNLHTGDAPAVDPGRYTWNYYGYDASGEAYADDSHESQYLSAFTGDSGRAYWREKWQKDSSGNYVMSGGNKVPLSAPTTIDNIVGYLPSEKKGGGLPRLENRFAPADTVITHCVYHRVQTSNATSADIYGADAGNVAGARDIVLRVDGSAKSVDVSSFVSGDKGPQWQLQNF